MEGIMRNSPLKQIWDRDDLVGLVIVQETACDESPTRFEEEIVRIFNEWKELKNASTQV